MAFEDLSAYSINDAGGYLTISPDTKVTWADLPRNVNAFLYKDKGVNHFAGNFTHRIETQFTGWGVTNYGQVECWMIANAATGRKAIIDAGGDCLHFTHEKGSSAYKFWLQIYESGVLVDYDSWDSVSLGVAYYVTIVRNEAAGTLTAYIRTGSHSGPLQDTLVASIGVDNDFRYIYAAGSYNSGHTGEVTGFTRNIDLAGVIMPIRMHHYKQMQGVS